MCTALLEISVKIITEYKTSYTFDVVQERASSPSIWCQRQVSARWSHSAGIRSRAQRAAATKGSSTRSASGAATSKNARMALEPAAVCVSFTAF